MGAGILTAGGLFLKLHTAFKKKTEEKGNQFSTSWREVGETVTTVVGVVAGIMLFVAGVYYFVTTGDSKVMEQGLRTAGVY